jgi:adenine phosphoribosyltransferase
VTQAGPPALEARLREAIASIGGHMDVWAVFEDGDLFGAVVAALAEAVAPLEPTKIVGVESRGFLLGGAVAARLGIGFVAVRRPGSLFPGEKVTIVTEPDYRGNRTELRFLVRSVSPDDRVAMVDDWIEVGAQALAVRSLVVEQGATFLGLATMVDGASGTVSDAVPVVCALMDDTM